MAKNLILLNAEADALTVSWPDTTDAIRYVLQYRPADQETFTTLSENLKTTQVRKKNLSTTAAAGNKNGFWFRVGAVLTENEEPPYWTTHDQPFGLLTAEQASKQMTAPKVWSGGTAYAGIVSWKAANGAEKYELQMRENVGGAPWETIAAAFANTEVKKKNLTSNNGYQFRVRPAGSDAPFSAPSDPFVGMGLSPGLKRLFSTLEKGTLLHKANEPPVSLEEALGGKEFILLYASAHWCGPCRQYTPMLSQWYQSLGPNKPIEVVFLSADHDEKSFRTYYSSMPWLAINFEEDTREELMAWIKVTGVPRLCVLDGRTGRIIEDNAVGRQFDINRWRSLANGK